MLNAAVKSEAKQEAVDTLKVRPSVVCISHSRSNSQLLSHQHVDEDRKMVIQAVIVRCTALASDLLTFAHTIFTLPAS